MSGTQQFMIRVGCAGWAIRREQAAKFPEEGTHLQRYAQRFTAVEINSSFYRFHSEQTYARWAASVPENFQFSVKMPREITHKRRLVDFQGTLNRFLHEISALGEKRGPILIQLPPSLPYNPAIAEEFFTDVRARFHGDVVCEPRHISWFTPEVEKLFSRLQIARVAADPALVPAAAEPGGWHSLRYYRLHGCPDVYYSTYTERLLVHLLDQWQHEAQSASVWAIFDNTALGAATENALQVVERFGSDVSAAPIT